MIDALKLVLRDKRQDLKDLGYEKIRLFDKYDALKREERQILEEIEDIEKHIADIEKGDVN
jgi:hypothetical protein